MNGPAAPANRRGRQMGTAGARTLVCVATRRPWRADRLDTGHGRRQERGNRRAASGWRRPMRLMLIVVTVAVATLLDLRVSQATQMPWCAGTNTGDFFHYNCTLPTYEMCVQEVIAGNRGFCSPNPNYRGPEFVPPRAKRKRYHY